MSETTNPKRHTDSEIDINLLKKTVAGALDKNRVEIPIPTVKKLDRKRTYHAPSLRPIKYPRNLSFWLKRLYKLWWDIKEPFEVRYPHQWT
jgi:hypothetical protein